MNKWMLKKLMEAEPGKGGAANPPANDPPPANPPANDPPPANPEDKKDPPPANPPEVVKDLMDDDPPPANPDDKKDPPPANPDDPKPPTEEEVKAYRDAISSMDLGEGVKMDSPLLDKMMPALMKITGGDPKNAEETVKAFADYQREDLKAAQEQENAAVKELQDAAKKEFGNDTRAIAQKASKVGRRIFGDEIWNSMKANRLFANHPVVIKNLAALESLFKEDTGAVKKESGPAARSSDWRENMYGTKK